MSLFPGLNATDAAALAWEGLSGCTAWNSLSSSQKSDIINIITSYRERNPGTGY